MESAETMVSENRELCWVSCWGAVCGIRSNGDNGDNEDYGDNERGIGGHNKIPTKA